MWKKLLVLLCLSCFTSCKNGKSYEAFFVTYTDIAYHSYNDSYKSLLTLKDKIDTLIKEPTEENLYAAQKAWLASREPYGQTEVFRFYDDSPIEAVEGNVNPWPLDENWIDYVYNPETKQVQNSGIINVRTAITKETLYDKHEGNNNESNVTLGYHAIEFLLWGQDFSRETAGLRSYTDYAIDDDKADQFGFTAQNKQRRGKYLKLVTDLLINDLKTVVDAWAPDGKYRKKFLSLSQEERFHRVLTGMGKLANGELKGERIAEAYNTKDQENEHSCFSDNTHRDIILNAQGIQNIYLGVYGSSVKGTGLHHLVAAVDSKLADSLKKKFDATAAAANAMEIPFDNALFTSKGRKSIQAVMTALEEEAEAIVMGAEKLGIKNIITTLD